MDLLSFKDSRRVGIECKRVNAPVLGPSMRIALADLRLDELHVVYPGAQRYALAKNVEVVPLEEWVQATGAGNRRSTQAKGGRRQRSSFRSSERPRR